MFASIKAVTTVSEWSIGLVDGLELINNWETFLANKVMQKFHTTHFSSHSILETHMPFSPINTQPHIHNAIPALTNVSVSTVGTFV